MTNQWNGGWTPDDEKWVREIGLTFATRTEAWRAFREATGRNVTLPAYSSFTLRMLNGAHALPRSPQHDLTADVLQLKTNGALILSDLHVPAHDAELLEFAFQLGQAFGVESCVMNGDVFDFHRLSQFDQQLPGYGAELEGEFALGEEILLEATRRFRTYMDLGNHEWRLFRRNLQAGVLPDRMARMFATDAVTVSAYSYIVVNDNVRVTHPRNYSQVRTSVSTKLAEKYGQHVVMGHTHQVSYTRDRSGRYICIESGACADPRRLDYIQSVDSVNPAFMQGFVVLTPGGELLLIDPRSCDREWWLWAAKRRTKVVA